MEGRNDPHLYELDLAHPVTSRKLQVLHEARKELK